jgi:preprotein translocase subunit YajC
MNFLTFFLQAAEAAPVQQKGGGLSFILMLVLIFVVMWFFMIRPQQKKQKKIQEAREALRKGDEVITIGGIHGKIVDVREKTFVIAVEDNTHIEIEKAAVAIDENSVK